MLKGVVLLLIFLVIVGFFIFLYSGKIQINKIFPFKQTTFGPPGTTYYVDFVAGSDSNSGLSPSSPWKHAPGDPSATGVPASTTLKPGDTVIFKGGVSYNGTIDINWNGQPGAPITYDGNSKGTFGTGKAIIDGQGSTLGINARQYGFYSGGQNYIVINHFIIRDLRYIYDDRFYGSGPDGVYFNGNGTNITVENLNLSNLQKVSNPVNLGILANCFSCINESSSVSVGSSNLTDPTVNLAKYAGTPGHQAIYRVTVGWDGDDYHIAWGYIGQASGTHTLEIYQDINLTIPGWNGANPTGQSSYGYFIYNIINGAIPVNNYGAAITVTSHSNVTIRNNIMEQDKTGISFGAQYNPGPLKNIYIYNNTIWNVSWGIQGASGEVLPQNITNVKIYNNTIHDFYPYVEYGYWGGGWHNDRIYIFGAGAAPTWTKNVQFYDNLFYGYIPGATAMIYGDYNYSNISIYNNIFAAIGSIDVRYAQGGSESLIGLKVYNNDFLDVPYDNLSNAFLLTQNYGCSTCSKNVTIRNNIFWISEGYGADFASDFPGLSYNGSDYNLLSSLYEYTGDINYNRSYSIYQWQDNTTLKIPHDQHSVLQQKPQFKSFPSFAQFVANNSTTSKLYIAQGNCDGCNGGNTHTNFINYIFKVGDYVEYNFDNVPRVVTAVGTSPSANYIIVSPALPQAPIIGAIIMDWKANSTLRYDLNLTSGSPAIGKGVNLAGQIGTLDKAGNSRPPAGAGSWDMGAYEYESGGPTTTFTTTESTTSTSSTSTSSTSVSTTSTILTTAISTSTYGTSTVGATTSIASSGASNSSSISVTTTYSTISSIITSIVTTIPTISTTISNSSVKSGTASTKQNLFYGIFAILVVAIIIALTLKYLKSNNSEIEKT